jgi:Flp pilus assembly protein TadG
MNRKGKCSFHLADARSDQRGAAAAEFALMLPFLVLLLLVILDFGRVFDAWMVATNAAREGARAASYCFSDPVPPCTIAEQPQNVATNYFSTYRGTRTDLSAPAVTITGGSVRLPASATVVVQVTLAPYISDILRLAGIIAGNQITVTGRATMPV